MSTVRIVCVSGLSSPAFVFNRAFFEIAKNFTWNYDEIMKSMELLFSYLKYHMKYSLCIEELVYCWEVVLQITNSAILFYGIINMNAIDLEICK